MECWLYDLIDAHRERIGPRDEGALWLTFLPASGPVVSAAIEGAMAHLDEVMLTNLVRIIDGVGAEAAVLVVPRRDGRPRAVDRRLWAAVRTRVDPRTEMVDLLVVGTRRWTSVEDERHEREHAGRHRTAERSQDC